MAERVGFEPTERFPVHSISSAANSTTLAPLLRGSKTHYESNNNPTSQAHMRRALSDHHRLIKGSSVYDHVTSVVSFSLGEVPGSILRNQLGGHFKWRT